MTKLPFERLACLALGAMVTVLMVTAKANAGAVVPAVELASCCQCEPRMNIA